VNVETPEAREIDDVFRCLVPSDLLAFLGRERVTAQFGRLDAVAAARLEVAFEVRADDYLTMLARRRALERLVAERSMGIDAWLTPTVPMLPQPIAGFRSAADVAAWNRRATQNTRPGNLFGQCGVSLPIQHLGAGASGERQRRCSPGRVAAVCGARPGRCLAEPGMHRRRSVGPAASARAGMTRSPHLHAIHTATRPCAVRGSA
jgi:aspartyl-tRNA(Asn)/glutamyl-tRNA(Gln) amidotransferase subunit A